MHVNVEYPETVLNIKDVKAVIDAGDKVGDILETALLGLDDDICIKTSDESGIAHRENVLNISPRDTASLEDRRLEVLLRWYDTPIYTETTLRQKLDGVLGKEEYILTVDLENKTIVCEVKLTRSLMFGSVQTLLEKMVPLDYILSVKLRYNQYKTLKPYRYGELKKYSYKELRNGVMDKADDN